MSTIASSVKEIAEECLVRACWTQWKAIAGEGWAAGEPLARSIIDPEALVLASLCVHHREARLRDRLLWWARVGAPLMSVSRMKTLMKRFVPDLEEGIARFAAETGDARWAKLASGTTSSDPARPGKGPSELKLLLPATLMLRLRAGFGVGAKSDLLAFLIGVSAARESHVSVTAKGISIAIQFSASSVRRATNEMTLARMIEASRDRPPSFSLDVGAWATLLDLRCADEREPDPLAPDAVPAWRHWSHVYALLAASAWWGKQAVEDDLHPSVLASRARDIAEEFARWTRMTGWREPDPKLAPGHRYLDTFERLVNHVAWWVDRHL